MNTDLRYSKLPFNNLGHELIACSWCLLHGLFVFFDDPRHTIYEIYIYILFSDSGIELGCNHPSICRRPEWFVRISMFNYYKRSLTSESLITACRVGKERDRAEAALFQRQGWGCNGGDENIGMVVRMSNTLVLLADIAEVSP